MIELDGREYQVQSASENAQAMVAYINNYCQQHEVKNSKGETIYIDSTPANPLYMVLFGLGYLVSLIQLLIYNIGCAFSIPNASEKQLLNLCEIAGLKRGQQTKTTIDFVVAAKPYIEEEQETENGVKILTTNSVTLDSVTYHPAFDIILQPGQTAHGVLIADTYGAFTVSEDRISNFDTPVENMGLFKQYASTPGHAEESIKSLRERLQRRTSGGTQIDKAADAIRALPGVTLCNIYFNDSPSQEVMIGGIKVKPRCALVFVQGYNEGIAKAFFSNCICETAQSNEVERTMKQVYVTHAGQELACYIVSPKLVPLTITVYLNQKIPEVLQNEMAYQIMTLTQEITAGQPVTSAMILEVLEGYRIYGILGATVGTEGKTQSYQVIPQVDELLVFDFALIYIDTSGAPE